MRNEEQMRRVAEYCGRAIDRLGSMHPLNDFYYGVQQGLSWALGDIDGAWEDMEAEVERDIDPEEFASEQFNQGKKTHATER